MTEKPETKSPAPQERVPGKEGLQRLADLTKRVIGVNKAEIAPTRKPRAKPKDA